LINFKNLLLVNDKVNIFVNAISDQEVNLSYTWEFKNIRGIVYTQASFPDFLRISIDHKTLTINAKDMTDINIYKVAGVVTVNISNLYEVKSISNCTHGKIFKF